MKEHGGLDVLVNNAGIAINGSSGAPFDEQVTNKVNFFGTLDVCDALFPILRQNARICHVSSGLSETTFKKLSAEHKKTLKNTSLTIEGS